MIDCVALTYEHRSPAGVFALILPWNMPLYLLTWKIAPCLAFGPDSSGEVWIGCKRLILKLSKVLLAMEVEGPYMDAN